MAFALLLAPACHRDPGTAPAAPPARGDAGPKAQKAFVFASERCGECHDALADQWDRSAHAQAARSPTFSAMAKAPGARGCEACHAPLAHHGAANDPAVREGVTCEVCHTIREVDARPEGAGFSLQLEDNRMYGPLCDAKDHYFHRMGCSPLHKTSNLCAACHQQTSPVPSFTEFAEWQKSPAAKAGQSCQSCHMPGARAEVAVGSPEREGVPNHTFMGTGALRQGALALALEVRGGCGSHPLQVTASLTSKVQGHDLPTGLPGRQLELRVEVRDAKGREAAHAVREYAKVLLDAAGHPAPFYLATHLGHDNRLGPGETRRETFALPGACGGEVDARVVERRLSSALAEALHIAPPAEIELARARERISASSKRGVP